MRVEEEEEVKVWGEEQGSKNRVEKEEGEKKTNKGREKKKKEGDRNEEVRRIQRKEGEKRGIMEAELKRITPQRRNEEKKTLKENKTEGKTKGMSNAKYDEEEECTEREGARQTMRKKNGEKRREQ